MAIVTGGTAQPVTPTVGDAFGWMARDPDWISQLLLMGLIGLIPVAGPLQQAGWLLAMLDNLRAGRYVVPPAGFRYATRGVWLWLAGLIYGLVIYAVFYGGFVLITVVFSAAGALSSSDSAHQFGPAALLVVPAFFVWFGVLGLLSFAVWIVIPAIISLTERNGLAGAFDFARIAHAVRTDPQHNLAAGALTLATYLIAGLGAYVCFVGVIFSAPYALAVLAGVLRWYEASVRPGALPPPTIAASAR